MSLKVITRPQDEMEVTHDYGKVPPGNAHGGTPYGTTYYLEPFSTLN